jgi:putative endonuclease
MDNFWTKIFGSISEKKAAKFLKRHGYKILKKNYRTKLGEFDIIAKKSGLVVFVEVKAMTEIEAFSPEDHFDWKKQKKQLVLGKQYLACQKKEIDARFDLITVVKKDDDYFIEHYENVIQDG